MTFTAIDFETATGNRNSACAVGIITVENGIITDEYYSLIKPPNNEYNWHNIQVHGITKRDTQNAPTFKRVYPEIKKRLKGKIIVAHDESFDRSVLQKTMTENGLDYSEYGSVGFHFPLRHMDFLLKRILYQMPINI